MAVQGNSIYACGSQKVKTDAKYTFMELNSNYMLRLVPGALHTNLCVELEVCTNQEVL